MPHDKFDGRKLIGHYLEQWRCWDCGAVFTWSPFIRDIQIELGCPNCGCNKFKKLDPNKEVK